MDRITIERLVSSPQVNQQHGYVMKGWTFALHLVILMLVLASTNACMVANYQIAGHESHEGAVSLGRNDARSMHFVIPQYYNSEHRCRSSGGGRCRDPIAIELQKGVQDALGRVPTPASDFIEHIPSQGLVCIVTVEQKGLDPTYGEMLSVLTLLLVPAYVTHTYVLDYSVLLDFKAVKTYKYEIREKGVVGSLVWLIYPILYPFWSELVMSFGLGGPRSETIKEATMTFLVEAHRDGIFE